MGSLRLKCLWVVCLLSQNFLFVFVNSQEDPVQYLTELDTRYSAACVKQITARWAYITNVTDETAQESTAATNEFLAFQATIQNEIADKFPQYGSIEDAKVRREFAFLSIQGPADMPVADVERMNNLQSAMETTYATSKVCEYQNPTNCELTLEPDIENKLREATDYDELNHYWTSWHDVVGTNVKLADYKEFIDLQNVMAKANGFNDMSEMILENYNDGKENWNITVFKTQMKDVWESLRPYYNKLHAYVRMQLRKNPQYAEHIEKDGTIPAHLFGNMWAQQWSHLDNITKPFPNAPSLDATQAMIENGYTARKIFEVSDEFFTNLGLEKMTDKFWANSMLEKPTDGTEVVCHASAEDMCSGPGNKDFRIKMCTEVNMDNLITAHHEMGHIEYFMQYTNQHFIFRNAANPGFHEALGDALALAVTTPKHLQCVLGLNLGLEIDCDAPETKSVGPREVTETDLNFLYLMALDKISFFPFAISMDSWRWEVFEGKLTPDQYTPRWWEIRGENQGIAPDSARSPDVFDPAAKYHIVGNVEYLRYFLSFILQFQFYESMCIAANEYNPNDPNSKPLYQCDFNGNAEAGTKLAEMMKLGFSEPWPVALNSLTGDGGALSTKPLINYFQPLFDLLDQRLSEAGEIPCFSTDSCQEHAKEYLETVYEPQASILCHNASLTAWNYQTNLTSSEAAQAALEADFAYSQFKIQEWNSTIRHYEYEDFNASDHTKRSIQLLNMAVGSAALPAEKLGRYNEIIAEMTKIYGAAKICPYNKQICDLATEGLSLEPGIESILANSLHYKELAYVWNAWRKAVGPQIRPLYNEYIDLSNDVGIANGYANQAEYWTAPYESSSFKADMELLWEDLKPLYSKLHAYVRFRLSQKYPQISNLSDPIPAHILGNMWSQTWGNIYSHVLPYSDAPSFDVTEALRKLLSQSLDPEHMMFEHANSFFKQTGLGSMEMAYGPNAVITKPADREVVCHASAWDFCDGQDFRIKMCTNIDMEDFITIHHELGHINYYLHYKDLPIALRTGANPGFHEAIGDVIGLSVTSPKHMEILGLYPEKDPNPESMINYLMKMALDKVAFLPFGYLVDSFRWKVFDGTIPKENMNKEWLRMRWELQGIHPPFKRTEADFDPAAKYHVAADSQYIAYFVSFVLQFQIHKALCIEAGEYVPGDITKPLYNCDIFRNTAASEKLRTILESGASRKWDELLQDVIGQPNLDASALTEYFEPLEKFFDAQEAEHKYPRNWDTTLLEQYFGEGELPSTIEYPMPTTPEELSTTTAVTDDGGSTSTGESESTTSGSDPNPSSSTTMPSTTEDEGNNTGLIIGCLAGGLAAGLILGIGGAFYYFKRKGGGGGGHDFS